jgi:predicted transcriptional regulator
MFLVILGVSIISFFDTNDDQRKEILLLTPLILLNSLMVAKRLLSTGSIYRDIADILSFERLHGYADELWTIKVNKTIMIVILVGSIIILAIDMLGLFTGNIYHKGSLLWKLGLLQLTIWSVSELVVDHDNKQVIKIVKEKAIKIQNTLSVEFSRDKIYHEALKELSSCDDNVSCYATNFEIIPYDYFIDVTDTARAFMETWERKINGNTLSHRQIVLISSEKELKEVEDRINRYGCIDGYELSAIVAPPFNPLVDFFILNDNFAFVCVSTRFTSPYIMDSAFIFRSPDSVKLIKLCFEAQWNRALPIVSKGKGLDTINHGNLAILTKAIKGFPKPDDYEKLVRRVLKEPGKIGPIVSLLELLLKLHESDARNLSALAYLADKEIVKVSSFLEQMASGSVVTNDSIHDILESFLNTVTHSVICTSVVKKDIQFWDSPKGLSYLYRQKEAVDNGVSIERIFIGEENHPDKTTKRILDNQINNSICVRYICSNKLESNQILDFAISDNGLLIVDQDDSVLISIQSAQLCEYGKLTKTMIGLSSPYKRRKK